MWCKVKWVVLWSLWAGRVVRQPTVPVLVSNGWLRGSVAPAGTHLQYMAIPYATIVRRFQAPGPEPKWSLTFDAIEEYIRCRQFISLGSKYTTGQEDCQVLNVYTPLNRADDNKLLPVMVYIHGGGFFQYSASRMIYGPEFLTSKGVVLVTINYRLNIQGFLCLRIKEAPGNAGMKDQVAALKWVRRNIRAFGGDPDNVTLFGESAGATSVSYHVLSPISKGLFHKAIVQSGSSLCAWGFQYKPTYLASLLAKVMGFQSMDARTLYEYFMRQTDTDLVISRVPRQKGNVIISEILFTPCAEIDIEGEEPFLTELPHDLLSSGNYNKVPIILGSNTEEGLVFVKMETDDFIENSNFEKMFPKDVVFPSNETRKSVAENLEQLYLGENNLKTRANLSKMYGEPFFNYPVLEETELLLKTSGQPIYSYLFGYDGMRSVLKRRLPEDLRSVPGATHADDLFYLFSQIFTLTYSEKDMIEKMTTMWTNFAKYGDPTPATTELLPLRWPTASAEEPKTLLIDQEFSLVPLWYRESLLYWKEVYSKYRRKL